MANPQTEGGYTRIANEILEAFGLTRISGEENQVFWVIVRKTYGYQKTADEISLSQFCLATGMNKQNVCRALSNLIKKNMIIKIDKGRISEYRIQKDHTAWIHPPKKISQGVGIKNLEGRISTKEIKQQIRDRDSNSCRLCGYDGKLLNENLEVHHIDFNEGNYRENNLITLCRSCHAKSHTLIKKDNLSKLIIEISKTDKENVINIETHKRNKNTKEKKTIVPTMQNQRSGTKKVDPVDQALTQLLITLMEENDPKSSIIRDLTERRKLSWIDSCRLLRERGGRTPEQIKLVIEFSQGDDFWKGNILSMPTLRRQFNQLWLKAKPAGILDEEETWDVRYERDQKEEQ